MKKEIVVGSALLMALVLAGAGCTDSSDSGTSTDTSTDTSSSQTTDTQTPAVNDQTTQSTSTATDSATSPAADATTPTAGDITLVAALDGTKTVRLTWETSQTLTADNRFIIVRGKDANPEHTDKNFWERVNFNKKEFVWANQPVGTYHYRVCLTENKNNDVCTVYSNDVTVEVK